MKSLEKYTNHEIPRWNYSMIQLLKKYIISKSSSQNSIISKSSSQKVILSYYFIDLFFSLYNLSINLFLRYIIMSIYS